jgi:phosphoribosylglycinamide formyltransferase-1
MNIAVFVSGNGSNLQAIIDAKKNEQIKSEIALVISSNKDAQALKRAQQENIKTEIFVSNEYSSKENRDYAILKKVQEYNIDLIVLAGYMRILSDEFVEAFQNKIINIHPSLLPAFKGAQAIKDSFDYGVKQTGVTVHFVDKKLDHGPIILQEAINVSENQTIEEVEEAIHKKEHILYPKAITLIEQNKIQIIGRKVSIS